jgi:TfoX/Sxy family transcriptional regulator of competence genes
VASDLNFVEYVIDQMASLDGVRHRNMFGEYVVYYNEKVIALICDNQLFVKATQAGRSFIGNVVEAPPYPGAKLAFLIQDQLEDKEWLCQLIKLTEKELPAPKVKKKKKKLE